MPIAQLAGRWGEIEIVYGVKKIFCTGLTRAPRQDKNLLYRHEELKGPTKEGPLSFVLFKSPIASVSTVSKSHLILSSLSGGDCVPLYSMQTLLPRGWNYKELVHYTNSGFTWGWAEVLSMDHIVHIVNWAAWPEVFSLSLLSLLCVEGRGLRSASGDGTSEKPS